MQTSKVAFQFKILSTKRRSRKWKYVLVYYRRLKRHRLRSYELIDAVGVSHLKKSPLKANDDNQEEY